MFYHLPISPFFGGLFQFLNSFHHWSINDMYNNTMIILSIWRDILSLKTDKYVVETQNHFVSSDFYWLNCSFLHSTHFLCYFFEILFHILCSFQQFCNMIHWHNFSIVHVLKRSLLRSNYSLYNYFKYNGLWVAHWVQVFIR